MEEHERHPPAGVPRWLATTAGVSWRLLIIAAAIGFVLWMLNQLYLIAAPVGLALILASVAVPAARWMERRGLPRVAATLVTVLGGICAVLAIIGVAVPLFLAEVDTLAEQAREGRDEVIRFVDELPWLTMDQVNEWIQEGQGQVAENAGDLMTGALTGVMRVGEVIAIVLLALVLLFFFVKDGEQITGWLTSQVPENRRDVVIASSRRAWQTLSGYVGGLLVVASVDALAVGLGLLLIGVPLIVPLMLLTFLGALIPIVGTVAAGLIAVLIALVSGGPVDALLVLALFVIVPQVEGNFLQPIVMGRAVRLHPAVILIVLTAGATMAGITGAFLAVPVTAMLAAVGNEVRTHGDQRTEDGAAA